MIAQIWVPVKGRIAVAQSGYRWREGVQIVTFFTIRGSKISFAVGFSVTIISINQKLSAGYKIMEIMSTNVTIDTIYRGKNRRKAAYFYLHHGLERKSKKPFKRLLPLGMWLRVGRWSMSLTVGFHHYLKCMQQQFHREQLLSTFLCMS